MIPEILDESEKKQLLQETIDRLQYCKGFKEELIAIINHYDPHKEVKYTNNISEFKFSVEEQLKHAI